MEEREFIRDILNLNVVGNYITFQPCAKHFAKLRVGIDQKRFAERGDENLRVQFAFCIEHACFYRGAFTQLAQIVCDLPVDKTECVRSSQAKLGARGEIKEHSRRVRALRHSSADEKRLSSCLRNPRRNGTGAGTGAVSFIVPLKASTDSGDVTTAVS